MNLLYRQIATLETPRLLLRQWRLDDLDAYAAMTSDPEVMRYFPSTLNRQQSEEKIAKMRGLIQKQGWGFWAVELKSTKELIGLTGLNEPLELPFVDQIEIGWQYAASVWGKGYATEAAEAALKFAFENLKLKFVVAFTSELNAPSRAVMHRIGMHNAHQDFPHPNVPDGNPLKQHVLYEISLEQWQARQTQPS